MNKDNLEAMIKQYTDELMKMNREKTVPYFKEEEILPQRQETVKTDTTEENFAEDNEPTVILPEEIPQPVPAEELKRTTTDDIPGIKSAPFYVPKEETEDSLTGKARFSANVFTGNSAYPIGNAKVLITRDGKLFTYLVSDKNGKTKTVDLPTFPEENSLNIQSNEQYINYVGEVYAKGFAPKKGLLITAVGGADIVLDVQLTPENERVN